MEEMIIRIEAEINPTESEEKVKHAVTNIFGNVQTKLQPMHKGSILTAETEGQESLAEFHSLLRRERIRAAARVALLEGVKGRTLTFYLNKQVAYAGHISFAREVAESPLGPIKVKIECSNPRELINWLTFDTT